MSNKIQNKKLLTLDDLYNFYFSKNENCTFSSKETGYKLSVQVPAQFEINKEQNDGTLLFCKVKLMHSGENRNHSSVTDEALVKASKCLAYKPILANFMEYTDEQSGEKLKDFTSHDMILNDDGTTTYLEKQIGCFTSDEPYFEIEEDTGHNFLYGYCAIPKEYSDAYSIIKRKDGTKVSVELEINEMQYSASKKLLELTDVTIMGATCLGKDAITLNNIEEGMKNARLDIEDFSVANNSVKFDKDEKLIELLETLNKTLSNFNNKGQFAVQDNTGKEEIEVETKKDNFEEVTETVEVTETEETTEEEVTVTENESEETVDEASEEEAVEETTEEVTETESVEETVENAEENFEAEVPTETHEQFEKMIRTYEISHEDTRYALYNLLSAFEESDNDYYYISAVYDNYFVYEGWCTDKIYRQEYIKDGDNISFDGERIELFRELLTASEKAELEAMRSNYAALKEFKENIEKNELRTQKEEILYSEKYAVLAEKNEAGEYTNADFAELVREMDNYSLFDLETKVKVIHSDYITGHPVQSTFSAQTEPVKKMTSVKLFANPNNDKKAKPSRYGNLFKEKK